MFMSLKLTICLAFCLTASQAKLWSYNDYPWKIGTCGGKRQSPIDIISSKVKFNASLKVETFNFDTATMGMSLIDNGHTALVNLNQTAIAANEKAYTMFQGKKFEPIQFHYHWGYDDTTGSEHFIDGKQFPMEVHVVHMNTAYDLSTFLNYGDGALVLGFMIEKGTGNTASKQLTDHFDEVAKISTSVDIPDPFKLGELLPKDPVKDITYYEGSLTTPTCNEAVQWIVCNARMTMDEDQFNKFRSLQAHVDNVGRFVDNMFKNTTKYVSGNFRIIKPLNDRIIQRNFLQSVNSAAQLVAASALVLTVFTVLAQWIM